MTERRAWELAQAHEMLRHKVQTFRTRMAAEGLSAEAIDRVMGVHARSSRVLDQRFSAPAEAETRARVCRISKVVV